MIYQPSDLFLIHTNENLWEKMVDISHDAYMKRLKFTFFILFIYVKS